MLDSFFGDDLSRVLPNISWFGTPISPVVWYIIFFAVTTGVYTIYGGLKSAAWTDFMQIVILLFAGFLVPVLALRHAGDLRPFIQAHPEHFQMFKPPTHKVFPFTGVFTGFLSVGIWYSCTSQHMVQRVLSAKDEWNARMGVDLCAKSRPMHSRNVKVPFRIQSEPVRKPPAIVSVNLGLAERTVPADFESPDRIRIALDHE